MSAEEDPLLHLRWERDFYHRLLQLGQATDIERLLDEALALGMDVTRARQGYIELGGHASPDARWSLARGFAGPEVDNVRASISKGIMAEAVATGRTVMTIASHDPRFADRHSVRRNKIDVALCAPVGSPAIGVVYLQGRVDGAAFSEPDREHAEVFARHLAPVVDRLLARAGAAQPDPTAPWRERLRCDELVGRSAALAGVLKSVAMVAPLDIGVLLTGPTGSGKTLLARVIAANGPRRDAPFVEVNCAAVPESLFEAELFGARKGAYTGANADRPGRIATADGGTLFLDEVGELPLQVQAKLLQFLQSGRYAPVGDDRPRMAQVRVVAATNTDLDQAVADGRFRADLFYRLAVFRIRVPGLDERREDIAAIADAALRGACARWDLPRLRLSPSAIGAIEFRDWGGHVRELTHALETAAVLAHGEGVDTVEPRHLFPGHADAAPTAALSFQEATRRFQRDLLLDTLERCDWNVTEAAEKLDLARSYVYRLIQAFDLTRGATTTPR